MTCLTRGFTRYQCTVNRASPQKKESEISAVGWSLVKRFSEGGAARLTIKREREVAKSLSNINRHTNSPRSERRMALSGTFMAVLMLAVVSSSASANDADVNGIPWAESLDFKDTVRQAQGPETSMAPSPPPPMPMMPMLPRGFCANTNFKATLQCSRGKARVKGSGRTLAEAQKIAAHQCTHRYARCKCSESRCGCTGPRTIRCYPEAWQYCRYNKKTDLVECICRPKISKHPGLGCRRRD